MENDCIGSMEQFVEDVCIVIAGKNNKLLNTYESYVYYNSMQRLQKKGIDLIKIQGAQKKYNSMKLQAESFRKLCKEDNIELKD